MSRRQISLLQWVLLLSSLAFFHPFLRGKVPFTGDILYSFQPWLTYAAQNLQAGRLPLWNPYSACGEPFLANPQVMVLYPGAVVFWMFPFAAAWPLFMVAHQALLFWAAALLVKFWERRAAPALTALAATVVAWGGFTMIHWEFPSAAATLPFVPLVLLFSLAGRWAGLSLAVALLWTAGYSQFAVYGLIWGGSAMAWRLFIPGPPSETGVRLTTRRNDLFKWSLAVGLGVVLALPQILATWEVTRNSMRVGIGEAESTAHLLTPVFLIKFLLPAILDKMALPYSTAVFDHTLWPIQRSWLTTFFIGTGPLLLALAGLKDLRKPKTLFLGLSLFLFLSLAMGWEPIFSLLRRFVPGLRYMTHFSNAMGPAVIALALLIPAGLKSSSENPWPLRIGWSAAFLISAALAVSPDIRVWVVHRLLGLDALNAAQNAHVIAAARMSVVFLGATAAALLAPGRWRAPGLLVIVLAELWIFGRDLLPAADASFFHQPVPLARALAGTPNRLAYSLEMARSPVPLDGDTREGGYQSVRQVLHPSLHLPHRVPFTWGYEVFPLKDFTEFRRTLTEGREAGPQIDFVGGRHVVATKQMPFRLMARRANGLLYTNDGALQRVTWVAREVVIAGAEERLKHIAGEWKPAEEVVLEEAAGDPAGPPFRPGYGRDPLANAGRDDGFVWKEVPGKLIAQGENPRAGWLVYSNVFYPGWEAYVNGKRVKLWKANHAFQAVRTPAGAWEAVLIYRPKLFRAGTIALLSLPPLLAAGLFLL